MYLLLLLKFFCFALKHYFISKLSGTSGASCRNMVGEEYMI